MKPNGYQLAYLYAEIDTHLKLYRIRMTPLAGENSHGVMKDIATTLDVLI
jgi:hypothetical protein